jgi:Family of unknown function (DUF5367)
MINVMTVTLTLFHPETTMKTINNQKSSIDTILFIGLGAAFWFIFLLLIRSWGAYLFINGNPWLPCLFGLSFPLAWVLVKISAAIGQVQGENLLTAIVIMSITAMSLDSIGLTWFQNWYDLEPTQLLLVAAWLLWGLGASLAIGYWESRRYVTS